AACVQENGNCRDSLDNSGNVERRCSGHGLVRYQRGARRRREPTSFDLRSADDLLWSRLLAGAMESARARHSVCARRFHYPALSSLRDANAIFHAVAFAAENACPLASVYAAA